MKNLLALYRLTNKFAEEAAKSSKYSLDEQILLQHGLVPIQNENGTSWLASSAEDATRVYRVKYKDKVVVAKITRYKYNVENIQKLYQLGQFIGELKRHIPIVYGVLTHDNEFSSPQYIILVEELKELNIPNIEMLLGSQPHKIAGVFLDINAVKEIIDNILNVLNLEKYIKKNYLKIIALDLSNFLSNLMKPLTEVNFFEKINSLENAKSVSENISKTFVSGMKKIIKNKLDEDNIKNFLKTKSWSLEFIHDANQIIYNFVYNLITSNISFPRSHERYMDEHIAQYGFSVYDYLPETKSLMHLLNVLQNYGIYWYDLQYFNLMERESTGDIVIADPGNFRLI